jgi:hypothetical protein
MRNTATEFQSWNGLPSSIQPPPHRGILSADTLTDGHWQPPLGSSSAGGQPSNCGRGLSFLESRRDSPFLGSGSHWALKPGGIIRKPRVSRFDEGQAPTSRRRSGMRCWAGGYGPGEQRALGGRQAGARFTTQLGLGPLPGEGWGTYMHTFDRVACGQLHQGLCNPGASHLAPEICRKPHNLTR